MNRKKLPLYSTWGAMKQRCINPKHKDYRYYGAKGVSVCQEWLDSFESFQLWAISNGWKPGMNVSRKNDSGNYEPENCSIKSRYDNISEIKVTAARIDASSRNFRLAAKSLRRKVVCLETGKVYDSVRQASKETSIHHSTISQSAQFRRQSKPGSFTWRYSGGSQNE